MHCAKCHGLLVKHLDSLYETAYWKCINCAWQGRAFEPVSAQLCIVPACTAVIEPPWNVCQRHRYEAEFGIAPSAETTMGKWSQEAKDRLKAKRGKPPLVPITNGQSWKQSALKDLKHQKSEAEAKVNALTQAIASLEAL